MKKSKLFKLIKKSIREQLSKKTTNTKNDFFNFSFRDRLASLSKINKPQDPTKDSNVLGADGIVPDNPSGANYDWSDGECDDFTPHPDITIVAGDCEGGGTLTEDINDGFICCSSNNNSQGGADGPHLSVDSPWGPFDLLDGYGIDSGMGQNVACYCPFPVTTGGADLSGDLINCFGGPGNNTNNTAAGLATHAHLDAFLQQSGVNNTLLSYGDSNGTGFNADGLGQTNGNHCGGCWHDQAENYLERQYANSSIASDPNYILGCGTGINNYNRDDISCCEFSGCASNNLPLAVDGAGETFSTTIDPENQSTIITPISNTTLDWFDVGAGTWTDDGSCVFKGCNNTANYIDYYTVTYDNQNLSGAGTFTTDLGVPPCTNSLTGCTNDTACNHNPDANTDDGSCEWTSCTGCMDVDGSDPALQNTADSNNLGAGACNGANGCVDDLGNPEPCEISDVSQCDYTTCVGCMDDGTTNPGTDRGSYTYMTPGIAACNYNIDDNGNSVTFTVSNPDACNYTDCVGCNSPIACNDGTLATGGTGATIDDAGLTCNYDCYGCTTEGMNGFAGAPVGDPSIYSIAFTNNNSIVSGLPADPASTPCQYNGCLTKEDPSGVAYENYVCNMPYPYYELCNDGSGGQCGAECPDGDYDPLLGTFNNPNNVCTVAAVDGCANSADCNYTPGANSGDQTVGGPFCVGVPSAPCEACGVDANNANAVVDSGACGCTDEDACNFDSTASADNGSCILPGLCERCEVMGTGVEPDPQCTGCLEPAACNFGWYTENGQLNYDPTSPIVDNVTIGSTWGGYTIGGGYSGFLTDDGSCVGPGGSTTQIEDPAAGPCDMCVGNIQPAGNTDNSAVGWVEFNPACDGCANPDACNYDPSAQDPNDPSCIVPDLPCFICDPADPAGFPDPMYNSSLIDTCECKDVIAKECNNETNIKNFTCMTIDGDQPLPEMSFETEIKVQDALEESTGKLFKEGKFVSPYATLLTEQKVNTIGGGKYQPEPSNSTKKIFIVTSVVNSSGTPKDFPQKDCVDVNWECHCANHDHPSQGPGWPGHPHYCKSTTESATTAGIYETKQECRAVCDGSQSAVNPYHTNEETDDSHLYATNPNTGGVTTTNCFIGDTLITMPDNTTRRIDDLKVDEIVKSKKETSKIIKIDVHGGEFDLYSINGFKHFVTEEHPFQTTEGWKAIIPDKTQEKHQIEALALKVGDILIKDNGETEEIISLEKTEEKINTTVYNLRLDNEHVYYANNYLVHNGDLEVDIPFNEAENVGGDKYIIKPGGGPGVSTNVCCQSYNNNAVNHPNCGVSNDQGGIDSYPWGFRGCCLPSGTTCPAGSFQNGNCSTLTGGGQQGSCGGGTNIDPIGENKIPQEVIDSKKLRESFKNEFTTSSKSQKEAKLRETIRKIIRNKKK